MHKLPGAALDTSGWHHGTRWGKREVARRRRLMVSTRWRRTPSGKEQNKARVRRWVEAFNKGDLEAVDDLVTDSYVRHDPNSPQVRGPEEEKQLIAMYRSAFPDLRFTIEDMVADGDR